MNTRTESINSKLLILSLLLFSSISNCRHKPSIPENPAISFKDQVQPIFAGSCGRSGCHDAFSEQPYLTYEDIIPGIQPGNARKSSLYKTITSLGPNQMPPDQPLSEEQLKLIYVWIMQGAKNN